MKSLEEKSGGGLTHEVYGRSVHHWRWDVQIKLEMFLIQERLILDAGEHLIISVTASIISFLHPSHHHINSFAEQILLVVGVDLSLLMTGGGVGYTQGGALVFFFG